MQQLLVSEFFKETLSGLIVQSRLAGDLLVHQRVPVITYPYEWSFQMLKAAAQVQLHVLKVCLENGFILKDGSGFNTLYHQGQMVFVDLLSVDYYKPGQVWEGYAQFYRHFLYPLMLQSKFAAPFQGWWRGEMNGISARAVYKLLGWRALTVPGGFRHVLLQNLLSGVDTASINTGPKRATAVRKNPAMPKGVLLGFIRSLQKTVERMEQKKCRSVWSHYMDTNTYREDDQAQKEVFIKEYLQKETPRQLVDLGCNTGHYTRLAAPLVQRVVAVDYDSHCIDKLYLSLESDSNLKKKVVPMVG